MPVFTPINANPSKVHYTEYIRTENEPEETEPKPTEPQAPDAPEAE